MKPLHGGRALSMETSPNTPQDGGDTKPACPVALCRSVLKHGVLVSVFLCYVRVLQRVKDSWAFILLPSMAAALCSCALGQQVCPEMWCPRLCRRETPCFWVMQRGGTVQELGLRRPPTSCRNRHTGPMLLPHVAPLDQAGCVHRDISSQAGGRACEEACVALGGLLLWSSRDMSLPRPHLPSAFPLVQAPSPLGTCPLASCPHPVHMLRPTAPSLRSAAGQAGIVAREPSSVSLSCGCSYMAGLFMARPSRRPYVPSTCACFRHTLL